MEHSFDAAVDPGAAPKRLTLARWLSRPWAQFALVATGAFCALLVASHGRSTAFDNYVRVAYAWLHGRTWIDYPGRWLDAVSYHGHWYGVDGPLPAVLMLPSVLLRGLSANETNVAILLCLFCLAAYWQLMVRLQVPVWPRIALSLFLFAGTDLWWCAMLGDVWFMAHLSAVLFTLLALLECAGARRGWLAGIYAFCAFESRFTLILAVPLYAYLLWSGALASEAGNAPVSRKKAMLGFASILGFGAICWLAYNESMWGTWNDIGHTLYFHQDAWGAKTGSPFSLAYLPYQFYSFFLQAPVFVEYLQRAQWPFFKADFHGIALTFTSPALVLAFLARTDKRLSCALWITTALVAGPSFLYYLNGWYQFGMRHALDFEPFLLVLMAFYARRGIAAWGYALIAWSAMVGTWGVWYWDTFVRQGNG